MFRQENRPIFPKTFTAKFPTMLVFLLLLPLVGIMSSVEANTSFTNSSIAASWGFSASGTIMPDVPAVAMGVILFDGIGECSISDTLNIGGVSDSRSSTSCTYSVNADGTGTISVAFTDDDPVTVPLSFVIVDKKNEIRFIRTDLGVANGVAKRQ